MEIREKSTVKFRMRKRFANSAAPDAEINKETCEKKSLHQVAEEQTGTHEQRLDRR